MELEPDSQIHLGTSYKQICLGVLGKREDIQKADLHDKILHPLLETIGRIPDIVYLPSDGMTSALIGTWAERGEVKFETIHADCRKLGRRAFALRDSRILKSATHLLLFEQPKSEYIVKLGIRELKKGKEVFSIGPGKEWELQHWEQDMTCKVKD
jgi:hypothetical protein